MGMGISVEITVEIALGIIAEITMGSNGNLVFDPSELTISAGESVTITNGDQPTHNFDVADPKNT